MVKLMEIIKSPEIMQRWALALRSEGKSCALVPTMGFLHEGHLSLVKIALSYCDTVVLSLFVNPIQFGPNEDYAAYLRDYERDRALCEAAGVSVLFSPEKEAIYQANHSISIEESLLSSALCGKSRPGHFSGVLTIVAKLFNICLPSYAIFGAKDAQQLRLIKRMVRDLNFSIEIIEGPTIRETDGLAMSSRNAYLSPEERQQALVISQSLNLAEQLIAEGERNSSTILAQLRAHIESAPLARIDYLELVDDESLQTVEEVSAPVLVALAVHFDKARLIDNRVFIPAN